MKKTIFASFSVLICIIVFVIGTSSGFSKKKESATEIESLRFARSADIELDINTSSEIIGIVQVKFTGVKPSGNEISFVSENEKVATVDLDAVSGGLFRYRVTAVGEGETYIYAITADGDERTDKLKVTVTGNSSTGAENSVDTPTSADAESEVPTEIYYVLNTSSKKIHYPSCSSVGTISEKNYATASNAEEALTDGYEWCKRCKK